jgi:hypothetical protein
VNAAEYGDDRLPARFWARVRADDASGCWEWTASLGRGGYRTLSLDGRNQKAHRIAYAALVARRQPRRLF